MSEFLNVRERPVRLILGRDLIRSIRSGHPWVFRDALRDVPQAPAGSVAELFASDGRRKIATGMYDPSSPVAFRVCSPEGRDLQDAWFLNQFELALKLRNAVRSNSTTGYRLINGEGDGLPGLVIDVYGGTAVIKLDGNGPESFWNAEGIAKLAVERLGLRGVIGRVRGDRESVDLTGRPENEPEFLEHGIRFTANVRVGQKTGFFLDQRENRQTIRGISSGRNVLNLFSYTGGFSVAAGIGGAKRATSVDLAGPAVRECDRHWELNGLSPDCHESVAADAFEYLEQAAKAKREWDVVIVDPPSFAPSAKRVERARTAYLRLMTGAAAVVSEGGILAASSCSSHISEDVFLEILGSAMGQSRRRGQVLSTAGQPLDHPWPLACRELRYLKFVLLRLSSGRR